MSAADGMENVGIYNVCQTMRFAYGRPDLIRLENNEQGGARIMIDIPFSDAGAADETDAAGAAAP